MQKAVYGPQPEGHYALHKQHYCHFTSPIRRYPDLTVHRIFNALEAEQAPPMHFGELVTLGGHCSDREQRAEIAERELVKVKLLTFLSGRIGQALDAVITGVEEFGLFAQAVELPADGFIHVSSLQDDYYRYDESARCLVGHRAGNRYRLGDFVRVEVAHVDIDRRELDFRLIQRTGRAVDHLAGKKGAAPGRPTEPSRGAASDVEGAPGGGGRKGGKSRRRAGGKGRGKSASSSSKRRRR
jgi:ribonuclease R